LSALTGCPAKHTASRCEFEIRRSAARVDGAAMAQDVKKNITHNALLFM
jgi:hypothetical protein